MGVAPKSRRHATPGRERRVLSVRARIVVTILLVAALGLLASGVATFFVQRERALSSVDQDLIQRVADVKAVAAHTTGEASKSVDGVLRAAIQRIVPENDESTLGIIDGKPALLPAGHLSFRLDQDRSLVTRLVSEADQTKVVMGTAKTPNATIRYVIVPVSVAGDTSSGLYVAGYNLNTVLGSIAESFQVYAIVAAAALVVIGLVAWFVAGRLLRPLVRLRDAAAHNSASDLTRRIRVTGNDDISKLTVTINHMFERLEESFTAQRRLLDDVGHELKTPITIVRGHIELMESSQPDDVDATRALAIDELDRMSELVSEISLLAESREPGFVIRDPVELGDLTESVVAKASALAPDRTWILDETATGVADFDSHRITQAWLQLADNAVKYSTPGGEIRLGSSLSRGRTKDEVHLWVRDSGPGISDADRERVFDRFVRLDATRDSDGSGLGLAIVAAIAEAHGGDVRLSSSADGSIFTIALPVSSEARAGSRGNGAEEGADGSDDDTADANTDDSAGDSEDNDT